MNRYIILFAAVSLLCSGCEKITDKAAADQKVAAAQEAAAKATAKVTTKLAARAAAKAAVSATDAEARQAAEALVGLLCSSPKLMEDIESDMNLLEALSGEGADRREAGRQFLESQKRYRAMLEKALPARGSTYKGFSKYAMGMLPGQVTADRKLKFKALIDEKCPRGNRALVEQTAGGLMSYCAGPDPK
jgi:uncharacterized protein YceK